MLFPRGLPPSLVRAQSTINASNAFPSSKLPIVSRHPLTSYKATDEYYYSSCSGCLPYCHSPCGCYQYRPDYSILVQDRELVVGMHVQLNLLLVMHY